MLCKGVFLTVDVIEIKETKKLVSPKSEKVTARVKVELISFCWFDNSIQNASCDP